jgi:ATP-binding cassette subfamily F protein 3
MAAVDLPGKLAAGLGESGNACAERSRLDYVIDGDREYRLEAELQLPTSATTATPSPPSTASWTPSTPGPSAPRLQPAARPGFSNEQLERPVSDFSGGWRMRLNLAQALICRSDLLLLDEPTNHLDLDAVIWLEKWLKSYQGTLILISRPRLPRSGRR